MKNPVNDEQPKRHKRDEFFDWSKEQIKEAMVNHYKRSVSDQEVEDKWKEVRERELYWEKNWQIPYKMHKGGNILNVQDGYSEWQLPVRHRNLSIRAKPSQRVSNLDWPNVYGFRVTRSKK